jgi:hypothetical protein
MVAEILATLGIPVEGWSETGHLTIGYTNLFTQGRSLLLIRQRPNDQEYRLFLSVWNR